MKTGDGREGVEIFFEVFIRLVNQSSGVHADVSDEVDIFLMSGVECAGVYVSTGSEIS